MAFSRSPVALASGPSRPGQVAKIRGRFEMCNFVFWRCWSELGVLSQVPNAARFRRSGGQDDLLLMDALCKGSEGTKPQP